jgi:hypothetical protein
VFESIAHEEADSVFGIDLRKWAEGGWGNEEVKRDTLPPVLTTLLNALNAQYGKIPDDSGWWKLPCLSPAKQLTDLSFQPSGGRGSTKCL